MKKHLITFLTLLFVLPTLWAGNFTYHITQEQTISEIQAELQTAINNNEQVIVVGSKTDADQTLALEIATGKNVVWQAVYQSNPSLEIVTLISFSGAGTFEVAGGTLITKNANAIEAADVGSTVIVSGNGTVLTSGTVVHPFGPEVHAILTYGNVEIKDEANVCATEGEVIVLLSDNAIITVSGGSVTTTKGSAIITIGKNAKVYVSGGYVCNDADDSLFYAAISAYDPQPYTETLVHVSGNGKVEAKGYYCAIYTTGSVIVSENAQVWNSTELNNNYSVIEAQFEVYITGNAQVSTRNKFAVFCYKNVYVSGNSIVEAKDNAIAISTTQTGKIEIKDKAQILAGNNYAISTNISVPSFFKVQGGVVFSYGKKISDVINYQQFLGPTGTGVVLAWNNKAGNTHYEKQSKEDIFVWPATATAHWDVIGGKAGIYYANGTNTGFIPLEVSVLSVSVPAAAGFEVWPNPTTGEFTIDNGQLTMDNGQWTINSIGVFDVYGRKQKSRRAEKQKGEGEVVLNISHLPAGVYFLKVGNGVKRVVKL